MEGSILKVAVDTPHGRRLYNFNQKQPLVDIIYELSGNATDCDNLALQCIDNDLYITESNRESLVNGALLKLTSDPEYEVTKILRELKAANHGDHCYVKLSEVCKDATMSEILLRKSGLKIITAKIENGKCNDFKMSHLLNSCLELLETPGMWHVLNEQIIAQVLKRLRESHTPKDGIDVHSPCLSLLENLVSHNKNYVQILTQVSFNMRELKRQLNMSEHQIVQCHALTVVNVLFAKKMYLDTRTLREMRHSILNNIIRSTNTITDDTAHQLYLFQSVLLNKYSTRMMTGANSADIELKQYVEELTRLAFENLSDAVATRRMQSISDVDESDFKNLGFVNTKNPLLDFTETPPGILALDCMRHFARHHQNDYIRLVLENNSSSAKSHQRPLVKSSISLVKVICEFLKVGAPPNEIGSDIQPIVFSVENALEEIYSVLIMVLNKTWKEMNAKIEDFDKVINVVSEQYELGMEAKPSSSDQLKTKLHSLSYIEILKIRQSDSSAKEIFVAKAKPVVELQDRVKKELTTLIEKQRLGCVIGGGKFQRFVATGKKYGSKASWFCRVSINHRYIYHGTYDEKNPKKSSENLTNKIEVADIKDVLFGRACPHIKQVKSAAKGSSAYAITIHYEPDEYLNLVAPDETAWCTWVDGLSLLTGSYLQSELVGSELDMLLSMEMKLRLLDLENIEISDHKPTVPPPPNNFVFASD